MSQEEEESGSLSEALWKGVQDQSAQAASDTLTVLKTGMEYVTSELVFAFSPMMTTSDQDNYGMMNSLEISRRRANTMDVSTSKLSDSARMPQRSSRSKSPSKKQKPQVTRKKFRNQPPLAPVVKVEERDERSETSHRLRALIQRLDPPEQELVPKSNLFRDKLSKKKKAKSKKTSLNTQKPLAIQEIQDSKPKKAPSKTEKPLGIKEIQDSLTGGLADELSSVLNEVHERPQDIFRPREENMDDSERFGYFKADMQPKAPSRPEATFSPITTFREVHHASKQALLDEEETLDTRPSHMIKVVDKSSKKVSKMKIVKSTAQEATKVETPAIESTAMKKTQKLHKVTPEVPLKPKLTPAVAVESTKTDEKNIRNEIEDIQMIIMRFQNQRNEHRQNLDSVAANKDTQRVQEIKALVQRLERLSERHRELKAKNFHVPIPASDGVRIAPDEHAVEPRPPSTDMVRSRKPPMAPEMTKTRTYQTKPIEKEETMTTDQLIESLLARPEIAVSPSSPERSFRGSRRSLQKKQHQQLFSADDVIDLSLYEETGVVLSSAQ